MAIDNKTGEVRAMVGGPIVNGEEDYNQFPFNLATQGRRQPGSSFKPFTLAMALQYGGYGPDSIIDSAPQDFIVPNSGGKEHFLVRNFGDTYSGPITLARPPTSPTTRCTRRSASTSAPRRSRHSPGGPGSARRSRTTTR